MKEQYFEVWMEGYRATGEGGPAQLIATMPGTSFDDAIERNIKEHNNPFKIERNTRERYTSQEAYDNRRSNWHIWACNLFDNEADARKAFG